MSLGRTSRGALGDERGLSLLEITVVLLIIGLVVAFSAPTIYRGWYNLQCKRSATSLASIFRFAHQQAILTKETQVVQIDLDSQLTRIIPPGSETQEGEDAGEPKAAAVAPLYFPSTVKPRLIIPERAVVIDRGKRDVRFFPTGNSTGETIELVNVLGTVYRIVIDPVTGIPSISRGAT